MLLPGCAAKAHDNDQRRCMKDCTANQISRLARKNGRRLICEPSICSAAVLQFKAALVRWPDKSQHTGARLGIALAGFRNCACSCAVLRHHASFPPTPRGCNGSNASAMGMSCAVTSHWCRNVLPPKGWPRVSRSQALVSSWAATSPLEPQRSQRVEAPWPALPGAGGGGLGEGVDLGCHGALHALQGGRVAADGIPLHASPRAAALLLLLPPEHNPLPVDGGHAAYILEQLERWSVSPGHTLHEAENAGRR